MRSRYEYIRRVWKRERERDERYKVWERARDVSEKPAGHVTYTECGGVADGELGIDSDSTRLYAVELRLWAHNLSDIEYECIRRVYKRERERKRREIECVGMC